MVTRITICGRSELLILSSALAWAVRPTPLLVRAELELARARSEGVGATRGEGRRLVTDSCVAGHLRHGDKRSFHALSSRTAKAHNISWHLTPEALWRCGADPTHSALPHRAPSLGGHC